MPLVFSSSRPQRVEADSSNMTLNRPDTTKIISPTGTGCSNRAEILMARRIETDSEYCQVPASSLLATVCLGIRDILVSVQHKSEYRVTMTEQSWMQGWCSGLFLARVPAAPQAARGRKIINAFVTTFFWIQTGVPMMAKLTYSAPGHEHLCVPSAYVACGVLYPWLISSTPLHAFDGAFEDRACGKFHFEVDASKSDPLICPHFVMDSLREYLTWATSDFTVSNYNWAVEVGFMACAGGFDSAPSGFDGVRRWL
ncbi:hypothetical protein K438DRAFT_1766522 [Mycena galopus ATCC 62051]|nr:hypothetical protein K438DRAFT_1766522 [Mycena galopus ATCC 62051]